MDQRHADYLAYYRARVKKYENNPLYPFSYQAELNMLAAFEGCEKLEDFKSRVGDLPLKCAIALVKDQETARLAFYEEINEPIKAKYSRLIIEAADKVTNVYELTETVSNLMSKMNLELAVDGFAGNLYFDFTWLENMEENTTIQVGEPWKSECRKHAQEDINEHRKLFNEVTLPRAREWDPNWKMNYDLVWEDRHRRKIPAPDAVVKQRIEEHKRYLGGA
ncbi:MAG: hypothetical protein A2Y33_02575 [Spirochaetes bacterium GWF1_51_8]|nr:MAG: hypothetical protein A2Y33_02575 [Spirochaetes bacterium GWF1_51_8]